MTTLSSVAGHGPSLPLPPSKVLARALGAEMIVVPFRYGRSTSGRKTRASKEQGHRAGFEVWERCQAQ